MKQRITFFLTVYLLAAASFVFAQTAEEPVNYGTADAGTDINPYQIATWQNLYWLSQNSDYWDDHFVQTADIDFGTASPSIQEWDGGKGWTPVGQQCPLGEGPGGAPFRGVYDGGDYSIIGLFSDRLGEGPDDPDDGPEVCPEGSAALFGFILDAVIRNLHLEDVEIYAGEGSASLVALAINSEIDNVSASGEVSGFFIVGGLIALADGCDIKNASSSVNIEGFALLGGIVGLSFDSNFENSAATGEVGRIDFDGGEGGFPQLNASVNTFMDILPRLEQTNRFISNAKNKDNGPGEPIFEFDGFLVGGFAGVAIDGLIERSSSTGDVQGGFGVGGFIGDADGTIITESFSTGDVTGTGEGAGGFAGFVFFSEIHNSYHRGDVLGNDVVGGFIGGAGGTATITFSYSAGSVSGNTRVNGFVGFYEELREDNLLIANSFWDVDTDGIPGTSSGDNNEGAIGRSTLEMQSIFTFDDVDWSIQSDPDLPRDYPLLTWQLDTNSPLWTIGTGGTMAVPISGWSHWITILLMAIAAVVLVVRKVF